VHLATGDRRQRGQTLLGGTCDPVGIDAELLEQVADHRLVVVEQCHQQVHRLDPLMAAIGGQRLGLLDRFLTLQGQFVGSERHDSSLLWDSPSSLVWDRGARWKTAFGPERRSIRSGESGSSVVPRILQHVRCRVYGPPMLVAGENGLGPSCRGVASVAARRIVPADSGLAGLFTYNQGREVRSSRAFAANGQWIQELSVNGTRTEGRAHPLGQLRVGDGPPRADGLH
jgi:hypothetical protein